MLLPNGHYHPNEIPNLSFPLGPARLTARLRSVGYQTEILDGQAEGLFRVAARERTQQLGNFVGKAPELILHQKQSFETVEVGLPDEELIECIRASNPDIILGTLIFSTQAEPFRRQIGLIRKEFSIPILIGGVAATSYPNQMGEHEDLVYRGKFDNLIIDIVDAYRTGEGKEQFAKYSMTLAHLETTLPGVIDVEPMDPNLFPIHRLPLAVYPEVENVFQQRIADQGIDKVQERYPYIIDEDGQLFAEAPIYAILLFDRPGRDLTEGLTIQILTREGCVFVCEGCHIAVETRLGQPLGILTRPISSVVDELKTLKDQGYNKIILGDDQALLPSKYLPNLTSEVEDMGFEFYVPNAVLVNAIAKGDDAAINSLIKAGLRSFFLAIESADQQIADDYWSKKLPNVLDITISAAETLRDASERTGIPVRVQAGFVIGHAGITEERETIEQIYDSMCFGRYLVDRGLLEYTVFSLYQPFPGTISYDNLKKWDMIVSEHAMTFGVYSIAGEDEYSPRSLEALRLAGWLFANRSEMTDGRSDLNLEPNRDTDPHAHIDKHYRELHLTNLEKRYESWVSEHIPEMSVELGRV